TTLAATSSRDKKFGAKAPPTVDVDIGASGDMLQRLLNWGKFALSKGQFSTSVSIDRRSG
ncbi:MAG: hypothetical protein ACK40X_12160, partial [Armatimonadota bacterium]